MLWTGCKFTSQEWMRTVTVVTWDTEKTRINRLCKSSSASAGEEHGSHFIPNFNIDGQQKRGVDRIEPSKEVQRIQRAVCRRMKSRTFPLSLLQSLRSMMSYLIHPRSQYLEFADALKQCDRDQNVNVIVVTANGKYFSSGNDLGEFASKIGGKGSIKDEAETAGKLLDHFTSSIIDTRKPIICGVQGYILNISILRPDR